MLTVDFGKAYRKAEDMSQCADDILKQSNKLKEIIIDIRSNWQGDTANAYIKKLEALEEVLSENAAKCREDAAAFRSRINEVREAEEIAKSALESLSTASS
jgi:uncharacterized protein YukE